MASGGARLTAVGGSGLGGAGMSVVVLGFWSSLMLPGSLTPRFPFLFSGFLATGSDRRGEGAEDGRGTGPRLGSGSGPGGTVPVHAEHAEAAPVDRRGPGVSVGGDAILAPGAGLAATPNLGHEVADLAFDLGTGVSTPATLEVTSPCASLQYSSVFCVSMA